MQVRYILSDVNILTLRPLIFVASAYICGGHLYIAVSGKYVTRNIPRWYISTRKLFDEEIDTLYRYYGTVCISNGKNRAPRSIVPYVGGIEIIGIGGASTWLGMEEIPKDVVRLVSAVLG